VFEKKTTEIWQVTVDRSPDILRNALIILKKEIEGQNWNKDTQERFAERLIKNKVLRSIRPTAGIGRAIFANLKFFGFAFDKYGKVCITSAGDAFIRASETERIDIIKRQLLKWQYPNPDQKGIKDIRLYPFRVCLKILHDLEYVTSEEMTLYVIKTRTKEDIENIKNKIQDFRVKSEPEKNGIKRQEADFYGLEHIAWEHAARFFEVTGLCKRIRANEQKRLIIADTKLDEVKAIISQDLEPHRKFKDEVEWFEYYGSIKPVLTLTIKVQSPDGKGISGVVVKAIDPATGTEIKSETTNDSGKTCIWLPQGFYRFNIVHENIVILDTSESLEKDLSTVITVPYVIPLKEPDVIELLKKAEDLPWERLEYVIARAFEELLGSKEWVEWRGGKGEPDIIIQAPLALTFGYAIVEGTKRGKAGLSLEIPEARDHAHQVKARYAILVSTEPFEERADDRRMVNIARSMGVILMTVKALAELLLFHREVGGITHEELKVLIDKASPLVDEIIDDWEKDVIKERSHFFLAAEIYGILINKLGEVTVDEILTELSDKHKISGDPRISVAKPMAQKALDILTAVGVITSRGIEHYKASLPWGVFLTRLQRLHGLVSESKGKFKPIMLGKGLEKYLRSN